MWTSAFEVGDITFCAAAHADRRLPRGRHENVLVGGHRAQKARAAETPEIARGLRHRGAGAAARERGKGPGARTACGGRVQRRLAEGADGKVSDSAGHHFGTSRAVFEISQ